MRHTLAVEVEPDSSLLGRVGQRQMQDRLHRWLEAYGHTASSFGFSFISVGVITGKRLSKAPKKAPSK